MEVTRRNIPVAKPSFDDAEERLVIESLRSGWVTQGPRVAEFERLVAEFVGAKEAVAVTSATTALFLALRVLDIGPGDEVIVPSLSFIATANSVVHAGATPVFVDVDPKTYNIDPDLIEPAITPRTRAIMPVDQLGMPADMDRINEIARRRKLRVIEDAACAIGSRYKGRPVGGDGDLVCFSFHPRKVIVTGEGGMITTNDKKLADHLRLLRHQGMSVSDLERHAADRVIIETYPEVGYNFRMCDIQASLGIAQMAKLNAFLEKRQAIARVYDRELSQFPQIEIPFVPKDATTTYQSYIVRLRGADARTRNAFLDELHHHCIATRRGLMAIHREPCHANGRISGSLQHTEAATDQTVVLPMYTDLSHEDQMFVIEQIGAALGRVMGGRSSAGRAAP
ncbi:MAG TPA: DegT/DnrJ/EryC1/StrS family aminotransferase [Phycisphaerae bacterium]|nr:DegT/DnrJ/EryC1/StrS family aminotransferase [Phycisphaerae bacterium]